MAVLAATDGTIVPDRVVETGAELAEQFGEELLVLHVIPRDVFESQRKSSVESTSDLALTFAPEITYRELGDQTGEPGGSDERYSLEAAQRDAAGVAADVTEETVGDLEKVSYLGRIGDVTEEILAVANAENPRYLVVGGRKRTPVGKAIFGSVTQSVLLESDLPVVTVLSDG
ncbi:universal stress protein [Halobellus captivus]|uniref:universal stress protein n=1 Tax=Halobellus captivus TaxID=2592614 RepID=UPI0011AA1F2C|nr:universal stress protein [Halobellus captivus]